ncbi:MAG TPA: threonine synthase, partial [Methanoregulaceae archaeon]|nr:threonine synthase [Methanoregulaceae archaeon]
MYRLTCVQCGRSYPPDEIIYTCRSCGHLLFVEYDLDSLTIRREEWDRRPISVWRYRELLPVTIP